MILPALLCILLGRNFELKNDIGEALNEVLDDHKTLIFLSRALVSKNPERKKKLDRMFPLSMDDSYYSSAALALQKDSEFTQGSVQQSRLSSQFVFQRWNFP